jgi:hypothetical protein
MQVPLQARNDSDAAQTDTAKTVAQKRVLADNWPEAVAQRKLAEMMNNSPRVLQQRALSDAIHNSPRMVAQRHEMNALFGGAVKPQGDGAMPAEASPARREEKTNKTGLPNQLKSGIESLSGMSMDHVKVHYNSDKPALLQAHAYAQGNEIHLGAGQERHLPHEAWHVVQQAQGRVRPTLQMKAGAVNDDPSLESEADRMGEKAAQFEGDHGARNLVAEEREAAVTGQRVPGFIQLRRRGKGPRPPDPVIDTLRTRQSRIGTRGKRKLGPRKAKWLRELEQRGATEERRKAQFLDPNSFDWMQHIDLVHIHKGRDAYDKDRDGGLDAASSFMENMANARAYIETAMNGGDRLQFEHYAKLHAKTMAGADGKPRFDPLHPIEDGAYGYKAGKGGRVDPEVLASIMGGRDNEERRTLHGMRAQTQIPPLYEYAPAYNHEHTGMTLDERVDYVRRKQEDGLLADGVMMEFPIVPEPERKLRQQLESFFRTYHDAITRAYNEADPFKRKAAVRLGIATLHQKLERAHPYADGNGRTNLALMNALLLKHGMSPAILDDPSSSHLVTPDAWAAEIKKGQERHAAVSAVWNSNPESAERMALTHDALKRFDIARKTEKVFKFQSTLSKEQRKRQRRRERDLLRKSESPRV